MRNILLEALLVAGAGAAVALAANALSPRGLNLTRDNFPAPPVTEILTPTATIGADSGGKTNLASATESVAQRLRAEGLRLAEGKEVRQLFEDPRSTQELVLFIDARADHAYQAGHIPGAYQFDRFYPEKYAPQVMQACHNAQQIVVYCNGGNCEDSEFAAVLLSQWGVPKEKLCVYGGGITEWTNERLPIELGARRSGNLRNY